MNAKVTVPGPSAKGIWAVFWRAVLLTPLAVVFWGVFAIGLVWVVYGAGPGNPLDLAARLAANGRLSGDLAGFVCFDPVQVVPGGSP
jgi:hypothetical protein